MSELLFARKDLPYRALEPKFHENAIRTRASYQIKKREKQTLSHTQNNKKGQRTNAGDTNFT
jgi:hypothetical protein